MKRDMDLVRRILLAIEGGEHGVAPQPLLIDGYTDEQIGYHVYIMIQGGLLEGSVVSMMEGPSPEAIASSMTWAGHEFIESARDEKRWKEARGLLEKVGGAAISVWSNVLSHLVLKNLGLP